MTKSNGKSPEIIIKKYANRRLYDTSTSQYVTLDYLRDLVKKGTEFQVVDAKSGDDLTRGVLAQIIFEEESRGANLLPVDFLRQLIGFYGGGAQTFLPAFLDMSMNSFAEAQKEWQKAANPMTMFEKQARRNMAMFEQAMKMFMPTLYNSSKPQNSSSSSSPAGSMMEMQAEALANMQAQMSAIQDQLAELYRKD